MMQKIQDQYMTTFVVHVLDTVYQKIASRNCSL